jgi:hypothetical protein
MTVPRIYGMIDSWVSPDCPPEVAEQFWRRVRAMEQDDDTVLFDRLDSSGIALPAPDDLDESRLTAKLWEIIGALAALGVYLHSTDHLSDRQLYSHLWSIALRQPVTIVPDDFAFAYHIDIIGSGSEEDTQLYLKHYADDLDRQSWAADFPDLAMPDAVPAPFSRDDRLPQPRNEPRQRCSNEPSRL